MGIEGVVLEDHGDVAVLRGNVVAQPPVDIKLAAGYILQTGDHAQRGGLSAAGRTDQHDKFLIRNFQVYVVNRQNVTVIDFSQIFQLYFRHHLLL